MTLALPTAIAELRRWPQWVIWRLDAREGKTTKIPLNPKAPGQRASSTDPKTWASYEATLKPIERGRADGAGFVFTATDEYAGIDLDHCVTDGVVHPKALEIVRRLDSYTEFSPSGTGLHILVRAAVNGKRNRTKNTPWEHDFEVYDCARFFTVTGRQLFGSPTTIESRQDELDAVIAELFPAPSANGNGHLLIPAPAPTSSDDDAALEEKIRKSKQGAKYDRLMAGDTGDYGEDDSSADMALCNILAWWLQGDAARIDAWFRRSGLYREKWEREDYRERTITQGIAGCTNGFYSPAHRSKPTPPAEIERKFATAAEELAAMCALEDDVFVELWRTGDGTAFRYVLRTRSGGVLDLDPLRSFTTAPKMNVEIASQLKTVPTIQAKDMPKFMALLGRACELRREMTLDDKIRALMASYVQEAPEESSPMDNDQDGRVATFRWLNRQDDPLADARSAVGVSRHAPIIVDPNTGLRFVRQSWFHAYVKHQLGGATVDRLGGRVEMLGWLRRGRDGRIKATPQDGGKELIDYFYVIPVGWEGTHGD